MNFLRATHLFVKYKSFLLMFYKENKETAKSRHV